MIRAAVLVLLLSSACVDDGGPRLYTVTPAASARGTMVMLTGRRLCGETGDCQTAGGEVQIGLQLPTVKASVIEYSDTDATVLIPDVTPVGRTELLVTVNERASNALDFEVLP